MSGCGRNNINKSKSLTFKQKAKISFEIFIGLLLCILFIGGVLSISFGAAYIIPILWGISKILTIGTILVVAYLFIFVLVVIMNIDNKKEDNK